MSISTGENVRFNGNRLGIKEVLHDKGPIFTEHRFLVEAKCVWYSYPVCLLSNYAKINDFYYYFSPVAWL